MLLRSSHRRIFAVLLIALIAAVGCKKNTKKDAGEGNNSPPANPGNPFIPGAGVDLIGRTGGPPAGWAEARDPVGGFRMFLPGSIQMLDAAKASPEEQKLQMSRMTNNLRSEDTAAKVYASSIVPPAGVKIGTSPDELFAGLKLVRRDLEGFHVVLSKEPVKLGGRAALKVVTKGRDLTAGVKRPEGMEPPDWVVESRKKDAARRTTFLVTTNGPRFIVIQSQTESDPDPAELKTMMDSFAFR
jgi:hypothetical protein